MPTIKCKHDAEAPATSELPECAVCCYKAGYDQGIEDGFQEGTQRGAHAVLILGKALRSDDVEALTTAVAHAMKLLLVKA
jgi:hypothetical protein